MTELAKAIAEVSVGKVLPEHIYIHHTLEQSLSVRVRLMVSQALRFAGEYCYNVLKIARDGRSVSLLNYPDFDTQAHPKLERSIKVFLSDGRVLINNYKHSENPPILHRKETLVGKDYPRYARFKALTDHEERLGLLSRSDIGTLQQWGAILETQKVRIRGHKLSTK